MSVEGFDPAILYVVIGPDRAAQEWARQNGVPAKQVFSTEQVRRGDLRGRNVELQIITSEWEDDSGSQAWQAYSEAQRYQVQYEQRRIE